MLLFVALCGVLLATWLVARALRPLVPVGVVTAADWRRIEDESSDLLRRRDRIIEELRDLELEAALHKLSAGDLSQLRTRYEAEAVDLVRRLDEGADTYRARIDAALGAPATPPAAAPAAAPSAATPASPVGPAAPESGRVEAPAAAESEPAAPGRDGVEWPSRAEPGAGLAASSPAGCAACGAVVPADAAFCDACGAPRSTPCAACGAVNRTGARFCKGCGLALGSGG